MDPIEILKQFKNIEPDKDYTKKSRFLIVHSTRKNKFGFWQLFLKNIELGTTVALTGLLIFMILGGFSAWRITSPLQISDLDPTGLKAEAQAIDIQIELANLNYNGGVTSIKSAESTPATPQQNSSQAEAEKIVPKPIEAENIAATQDNISTSSAVSIDEALQKLSE